MTDDSSSADSDDILELVPLFVLEFLRQLVGRARVGLCLVHHLHSSVLQIAQLLAPFIETLAGNAHVVAHRADGSAAQFLQVTLAAAEVFGDAARRFAGRRFAEQIVPIRLFAGGRTAGHRKERLEEVGSRHLGHVARHIQQASHLVDQRTILRVQGELRYFAPRWLIERVAVATEQHARSNSLIGVGDKVGLVQETKLGQRVDDHGASGQVANQAALVGLAPLDELRAARIGRVADVHSADAVCFVCQQFSQWRLGH